MPTVTVNSTRVLNRVNLSTNDIAATKVEDFIDDAIATIENETGHSIGELEGEEAGEKSIDVDKKFASVVTDLAAIYCIAYVTGGSASGLSFTIGDIRVDALERAAPIQILIREVQRNMRALKRKYFGRVG